MISRSSKTESRSFDRSRWIRREMRTERRTKQLSRCMSPQRERSVRSIAARFDSSVCWKWILLMLPKS